LRRFIAEPFHQDPMIGWMSLVGHWLLSAIPQDTVFGRGRFRHPVVFRCLPAATLVLTAGFSCGAELHPVRDPDHVGLGGAHIEISESRPEWRVRERRWASKRPLYMQLRLGDSGTAIPCTVDESGGSGTGYNAIYVDTDGDGDLSDEAAHRPAREQAGRTTALRSEPVRVVVSYADGNRRKLGVRIAVSGFRDPTRDRTAWSAQCRVADSLSGTVAIGARHALKIALFDRSSEGHEMNACFNDYGVDRLQIDLDGDGRLDPEREEFPLSRVVAVDGQLWEFVTDAAATRVVARPCERPTGRLRLTVESSGDEPMQGNVDLISEAGFAFTYRLPDMEAMVVPESEYRLSRGSLRMVDGAQRVWIASFSRSNSVAVARNGESALRLGSPYRVVPETEGDFKLGDSACITAHLFGAAGEEYLNVAPRQMRMKPAVHIEDAVEIAVAQGNMDYG
jgi:hypothetical protein